MARRLPISLDAGSSLPRNIRARHLRHLLHQQLVDLLQAPVHRPRRFAVAVVLALPAVALDLLPLDSLAVEDDDAATPRATRAASSDSSTLATGRGPPVMPDTCTAPERILVESPHHCESHGCITRVWLRPDGLPQEVPDMVMPYYPCHGWTNYARRDAGPSSTEHGFTMASPRCAISPDYTLATPLYSPTPAKPLEFLLRGTIAARRSTLPLYMAAGSSSSMAAAVLPGFAEPKPELAPPSPPTAPWFPGRPTAATTANTRPGLCHIIKTGHVSAEMSTGGEACRPPPSGEGEA
ncbi:hypothetical protein GQ55_5G036500 [Panicum hallii var. hallii]|uniref:Uncharacterized protein n=1 Tax=Panicum hallii var. hallii TaxID=1504633 RepID=A0A2T7DCE3_9POAL|nr:hypothetical protein GQ55_5G036500 [Panicum hallii var. hallii]